MATTPPTTPDPRRWWALALLCGAFFMVILDAAIVTVALPSIEKELDFSAQGLQWVVSAYALTFAGLLLLGGRAADLLGRRRVFMVGVAVFTLASLLCGLAWSDTALVGARGFQGIGAAVMTPSALSIITTTFEEGAERNKALGIWGRARRHRRDHGLADRRPDRRRPRLGVDLLHQHPGRPRRACAVSLTVA
jgi:MFS family permease